MANETTMETDVLTHNTDYEKNFLKKLGTGKYSATEMSRMNLLINYRDAMPFRVDWGGIDKDEIEKFVDILIYLEIKNGN